MAEPLPVTADWVDAWAGRYPDRYDDQLETYYGAGWLDREAVHTVLGFKLAFDRRWSARSAALIDQENDTTLVEVTRAARESADDTLALRLVRVLDGVGPAVGSALLMVMDPYRWTVYDRRALKTCRALGVGTLPESATRVAGWAGYLAVCRATADATGRALRHLDRALYAANGEVGWLG